MSRESNRHKIRFSIRVTVVGMFLILTSLTAATAIGLQYYFSTRLATESALDVYREAGVNTSDYLDAVDKRANEAARMLATYPGIVRNGHVAEYVSDVFTETLKNNPLFYAIYIGFANGDFYEVVNLDASTEVRHQLKALPQDRWMVITVSGKGAKRQREYRYYDKMFTLRTSRWERSDYQANKRPWFVNASMDEIYKTGPYLFQHLQAPGQTYSTRLKSGNAVLAVDIALSSLSDKLREYTVNSDSSIYLYKKSGELVATSASRQPPVVMPKASPLSLSSEQKKVVEANPVLLVSNESDWPPFDFMVSGKPYGYSIDVLSLISEMTGLKFRFVNGYSWPELKGMFRNGELDIIHPVLGNTQNSALGEMSDPMLDVPFGTLTHKGEAAITDIHQLYGERVAIPKGWSIIETLRREFPSVNVVEVDDVKGMFDAVRKGTVRAGIDNSAFLQYTAREFFLSDVRVDAPLDFGSVKVPTAYHYIVGSSRSGVVDLINLALANITPQQKKALNARWLISSDIAESESGTVPYEALISLAEEKSGFNQLHRVKLDGKECFVYLRPIGQNGQSQDFFAVVTPVKFVLAPVIAKVQTAMYITAACFLFLLPLAVWMATQIVRPVKRLAIENEKVQQRRYRELELVSSRIVEVDDLAGSLRVMAHSIEQHAKEQEALMDSFIELIAQAIDDKSPYTAGHCSRVPELAMMLAKKAEDSDEAPFDRFSFKNESEWREFRIGAWLHDCGKITTPEHIVDKGTKLETIYNRIHEVRMRFEVLWRDAEIDYLKKAYDAPQDELVFRTALEQRREQLKDDYAFIASCNIGGEFMGDDDLARVDELAQQTWMRNFDDRLGLSQPELSRVTDEVVELPVEENLLGNKPWHIVPRIQKNHYPAHLGIRMDVPDNLYDRGELHNLKISRGTLTAEDRFKINEHMISTIRMLDKLPLPKELERVPRYASTHHETLDGRGYPRKLRADDLSIPERIMVLADIYEALTAADRPYKAAKPVSVAIDILHKMVESSHVDRDVFNLFLKSGVFLEYANRYLPEQQIDTVEIRNYLQE